MENTQNIFDKLDNSWKDVCSFLKNNKNNDKIAPIAKFVSKLCLFQYDTVHNHPKKQVFVHHNDEWQTYSHPYKPCKRTVSFDKRSSGVVIDVTSQAEGENQITENALILAENKEGVWMGFLRQLKENFVYETYSFEISKNGNIKTRTFKKVLSDTNLPKQTSKSVKTK